MSLKNNNSDRKFKNKKTIELILKLKRLTYEKPDKNYGNFIINDFYNFLFV